MKTIELRIPAGAEGRRRIAMTAYLPAAEPSGAIIFAAPGGGYGRCYFDLHFSGRAGYSQAEHHVARGHVLIAYDHLGVGDSDLDGLGTMTIEEIADANHDAVAEVRRRLAAGELVDGLPSLPDACCIGIGQSMGGGVSIIMQGRRRSFDAIGVLGYSAIHTVLPQRSAEAEEQAKAQYRFSRDTKAADLSVAAASAGVPDFVYPFHWEDVPADILEADMAGGYPIRHSVPDFGSGTIPPCVVAMMAPGYVREEAASIEVPVFLGFGERDTSPDVRAEPAAFQKAGDISLFVVPRMAHMHNFAGTRALLWDRLSDWAGMVARAQRPNSRVAR